ncbi:hypothetical protein CLV63_10757 [Murinocardiopsis flavida]|uniref:LemA protein n=1 Tax=Murinocardiopsis flavida TaxID=645275 RepID=A0A2P8DKD3_9ACTN|nr:hypothetical protein [Murinocardiopsis flavida]PSK97669.1 hypothetical protein CLV63_10757 [Murinocardiopsis flavida]
MTAALAAAAAALVLTAWYLSWRAGRLDRLHARGDTARVALDAALSRRAAAARALAADLPAEPGRLLGSAAEGAARSSGTERELAESELSRVLRKAAAEPVPGGVPPAALAEVEAAAKRVLMARSFYNNVVAMTREARARRVVRVFRLAGRAPIPEFFEMDDEPPVFPPGRRKVDSR